MTAILLYLAASLLLVVCLILLFIEGGDKSEGNSECQPAHDFWCVDGSAMHVAKQLFGSEDWDYVQGLGSRILTRRFLKERKALALKWVRAARSEAGTLMKVHRTAASTSPHLNLNVELRTVFVYLDFLFYCVLLEILIRTRGPVALQRLVARADARSNRLYEVVGRVFPLAGQEDLN